MNAYLDRWEVGDLPKRITGKIPAPEAFALGSAVFPGRKPTPPGVRAEKLFNRGDTTQVTNTTTNSDSFNSSTSTVYSDLGNVDFQLAPEKPSGVAGTVSALLPLLLVGGAVLGGLFWLGRGRA